jgi:formylglycine-generating enzyme required for sulfatase activity
LRRSITLGISLLASLLAAAPSRADDYAVLLSVATLRSGAHGLALADANTELMRKALTQMGLEAPDHLRVMKNEEVTRSSVRKLLCEELPAKLKSGDRLILYYTGHGITLQVDGAPRRTYFTYDTKVGKGDTWDPETLLRDKELAEWLQALQRKNVTVIFFGECCFSAEGYSKEIRSTRFADELPKAVPVGTAELSACAPGQGASAIRHGGEDVGVFTDSLARALTTDAMRLTLADIAKQVGAEVLVAGHGQQPQRFEQPGTFENTVLFDRTLMTLVVQAHDSRSKANLVGAKVFFNDDQLGTTPLTRGRFPRTQKNIVLGLELDGYSRQTFSVELDARKPSQEIVLDLEPDYAVVKGAIAEANARELTEVRVGFELLGDLTTKPRHTFDLEVAPRAAGDFELHVPFGFALNVTVSRQATQLAKVPVNDGKPLESFQKTGRSYDAGRIKISLAAETSGTAAPPTDVQGPGPGFDLPSTKSINGKEMVLVRAGEFMLGDTGTEGDADERPARRVRISKAFYIDRTEVTFGEYRKFCLAKGLTLPKDADSMREDGPVVNVSWGEADAYATWAGKRLPTEPSGSMLRGARRRGAFPGATSNPRDVPTGPPRLAMRPIGPSICGRPAVRPAPPGCGAQDMAGNVWSGARTTFAATPTRSSRTASWIRSRPRRPRNAWCAAGRGDRPRAGAASRLAAADRRRCGSPGWASAACGNPTDRRVDRLMGSLARKRLAVLLLPLVAALPACSLTQSEKQTVSVITDRPAKIFVDEKPVGETKGDGQPLTLQPLERNQAHLVFAKSNDGLEARGKFDSTLSALGVLDTIGIFIFLIPGITLITGHAFELDPNPMFLTLSKAPPPHRQRTRTSTRSERAGSSSGVRGQGASGASRHRAHGPPAGRRCGRAALVLALPLPRQRRAPASQRGFLRQPGRAALRDVLRESLPADVRAAAARGATRSRCGAMIVGARLLMLAMSLATVLCCALLARRAGGPAAGWLAPLLLLTQVTFFQKSLEIRPTSARRSARA